MYTYLYMDIPHLDLQYAGTPDDDRGVETIVKIVKLVLNQKSASVVLSKLCFRFIENALQTVCYVLSVFVQKVVEYCRRYPFKRIFYKCTFLRND